MPHDQQLKSKVVFALKQLSTNDPEIKRNVGAHMISNIVSELGDKEYSTDG